MRTIGRPLPAVQLLPSASALQQAATHQATGQALASLSSTGIPKGVYRFKTPEEADAQVLAGLAWVIAHHARLRV